MMKITEKLRRWLRRPLDPRAMATQSGIADVDPGPLAQTAGEGIDPDENARAHEEIREQRDRLP